MKKSILLFTCLALQLSACTNNSVSRYAAVKSDVSYSSVLELGYDSATARLEYGDEDPSLQYGLLWLPQNLNSNERVPLVVFIHGG